MQKRTLRTCRLPLPGQVLASPVVGEEGTIYLGVSQTPRDREASGILLAIGRDSHQEKWRHEVDAPTESTPVLGDDGVSAGHRDGPGEPSRWGGAHGLGVRRVVNVEHLKTTVPFVRDQEMRVSFTYWEGAVRITGSAGGSGYVEVTGYATGAVPGR